MEVRLVRLNFRVGNSLSCISKENQTSFLERFLCNGKCNKTVIGFSE